MSTTATAPRNNNFPVNGWFRIAGPCLDIHCLFKNGKLIRKIEHGPEGKKVFDYQFDRHGRLGRVLLNDACVEAYAYDEHGRRTACHTNQPGRLEQLSTLDYDRQGRLITRDLEKMA